MKNRATKLLSLVLCAAVLFTAVGTSVFALAGEGKESKAENTSTSINVSAETETSKDETVYVLAGADGTVQKIIVSDWIKNAMATDSLDDKTELSDIENIKGDESFTLGGDNSCVWDAQGNDIYIHTEGIDKIPKDGRFLFVSNHRSNFDPILTWYVLKDYDLAFISKAENFRIPIFGRIIRKCCFI